MSKPLTATSSEQTPTPMLTCIHRRASTTDCSVDMRSMLGMPGAQFVSTFFHHIQTCKGGSFID